MAIWSSTARRRWSIHSMDTSNGAAARGKTTRQRQLTLIGLPTAITFDGGSKGRSKCADQQFESELATRRTCSFREQLPHDDAVIAQPKCRNDRDNPPRELDRRVPP